MSIVFFESLDEGTIAINSKQVVAVHSQDIHNEDDELIKITSVTTIGETYYLKDEFLDVVARLNNL
jgi:hypothetical protein